MQRRTTRPINTHIKRLSLLRFLYFILFGPPALPISIVLRTNKVLFNRTVKQHIGLCV